MSPLRLLRCLQRLWTLPQRLEALDARIARAELMAGDARALVAEHHRAGGVDVTTEAKR